MSVTLRLLRALFEARKVARTFCGTYFSRLPDRLWYKFLVSVLPYSVIHTSSNLVMHYQD